MTWTCSHRVVVEEPDEWRPFYPGHENDLVRRCLTCGVSYSRTEVLTRLAALIRERNRLPRSPWSAAERSEDC